MGPSAAPAHLTATERVTLDPTLELIDALGFLAPTRRTS
jgi:hypothetical protein